MSDLKIELPDNTFVEMEKGTTVRNIISKTVSDKKKRNRIVGVLFNGTLLDIRDQVSEDGRLEFIFIGDEGSLEIIRHSTAHVMAQAVKKLFPEAKLAIGPATRDGFYYDFLVDRAFQPEDLPKIEKEMKRIIKRRYPFEKQVVSKSEAVEIFREQGEKFKLEILEEIEDETVSLYRQGDFQDLCRGPHIANTGLIPAFKLMSIAGAYWRGDEKRDVLQRIYGTAFPTQEALDDYIALQEKIKLRDHRRLGKELDLFSIHDDVGAGLIFWHPKGAMIRHLVEEFWRSEHLKRGYDFVYTPHIARERIYEISGHLQNYSENMYAPLLIDEQPYRLKPMNCPGHIKIFQSRLRSYRDLPIRYCELGTVYRYERSGTLHGMLRVRGFTQDDAHVFCTPDQMADEVFAIIDLVDTLMSAFGYTYQIFLATRPEKYLGSEAEWEWSTNALKKALEKWGQPYEIDEGGGVFYAPKIDIKLNDALGRQWQGPTIQVDLNLPKRFGVNYIAEDSREHEVIMIHRAVLGSMERFVGGLIEHFGGAFPLWLAPTQMVVVPITDKQHDYARAVGVQLRDAGFRVSTDLRNEKLGYKIREAQVEKIPYMIVLGEREKENNLISIRHRVTGDMGTKNIAEFIQAASEEVRLKKIITQTDK